ncbi:MAG: helix-turn-helix domain-containing protein [Nitrospirae bacterium]|nr:helix-turn-helix domain-containing protein [Nitrospirota bacterium]
MELLGEYLKRIRESRNLTIDAVAAKTKISLSYLNAIEKSRFDDLPGDVFTKGFLRTYARFLSIDEKDIIDRYNQWVREFRAPDKKAEETIPKEEEKKGDAAENKKIIQIAGAAAVILLVILAVIFLRKEEPVKKAEERIDRKPKSEKTVIKENDKIVQGEAGVRDEQGPSTDKTDKKDASPIQQQQVALVKKEKKSLSLVIKAIEPSWLTVTIDNKDKKDMLLQPEERISLKAEDDFLLTLGNAGGVEIEFNGKKLEPFGPPGRVVSNILLAKEKIGHKKTAPAIKKPADPKEKGKEDGALSPHQDSQ